MLFELLENNLVILFSVTWNKLTYFFVCVIDVCSLALLVKCVCVLGGPMRVL